MEDPLKAGASHEDPIDCELDQSDPQSDPQLDPQLDLCGGFSLYHRHSRRCFVM